MNKSTSKTIVNTLAGVVIVGVSVWIVSDMRREPHWDKYANDIKIEFRKIVSSVHHGQPTEQEKVVLAYKYARVGRYFFTGVPAGELVSAYHSVLIENKWQSRDSYSDEHWQYVQYCKGSFSALISVPKYPPSVYRYGFSISASTASDRKCNAARQN